MKQQPNKNNTKQIINDNIDKISIISGLISISFLAIGLRNIDNYINWLEFPIILILIGCLFGLIIYFFLGFYIDNISSFRNTNNVSILTMLVVCFSFISFGIGSILNEYSYNSKICKNHEIYDMGESSERTKSYYIFINNEGKVERLSFGRTFNNSHKVGYTIELCVVTGWLGYKYYNINNRN